MAPLSSLTQLSGRKNFWLPATGLAPTAAMHLAVVEAGAAKDALLHRVVIWNPGAQTAAGIVVLKLMRTTAAGAGGAVTPGAFDPDDVSGEAFSGICRSNPTAGTEGGLLLDIPIFVPAAAAAFVPVVINLMDLIGKLPRIAKGVANGIALKHPGSAGAAGFSVGLLLSE